MKSAMILAMNYLILFYKRKVCFSCQNNSKPIYVQKPKLQHKQMSEDSLSF